MTVVTAELFLTHLTWHLIGALKPSAMFYLALQNKTVMFKFTVDVVHRQVGTKNNI